MRRNAGLALDECLDGVATCRWRALQQVGLDGLGLAGLYLLALHGDALELVFALVHHDLQRLRALGLAQHSGAGAITYHRELNHNRISRMQLHAEFALQCGQRHLTLREHRHADHLDGVHLIVGDTASERESLCRQIEGADQEGKQQKKLSFHT